MTYQKNIVVPVSPMGKPRMTQRDKWKQRPCVMRYRAIKDEITLLVGRAIPEDVESLSWVAYFPMPKSWSKKKKDEHRGRFHRSKPDRDNVDKAILDALFKEDCRIASGTLEKRWDDGNGPRIKLYWS